jgi:hypothetical protein
MDTIWMVAIIAAVLLLLAGAAGWWWAKDRKRSKSLREGFGLEYDRTLKQSGGRRKAEAELEARRKRVERLQLKEISPIRAQDFAERWRIVQGRFVDDPGGAVKEADQLCTIVMNERGYPMANFEQRAADLSVDHGETVSRYRSAHAISLVAERGEATTESLRQAMMNYRALFEELLEVPKSRQPERPPRETHVAR